MGHYTPRMASGPDISLILPAFNEARAIPVTIGEAVRYFTSRGLRYEIIVAADGGDVRINIRVIEFQIIENRGARPVVHEFRPLIEKRSVVLIRLDDEQSFFS